MSQEDTSVAVVEKTSLSSAFAAMTTDIVATMDDVVSAFVAQYENNLFARKKELRGQVKVIATQLVDLDKQVKAAVTGDEFDKPIDVYDLVVTVGESTISWEDKNVTFPIEIKTNPKDRSGSHYSYRNNCIDIKRTKPIPARFLADNTRLEEDVQTLRAELGEVLENIKTIDRKERQVRGRIAIRKLEDAGHENLMNDPELKLLVQLD